jgi:WhiB family redox-sensing transcriptional regulator
MEKGESEAYRDKSGLPGDWAKDANCRGLDPNLFHTGRGESTVEALAVCAGCLVVEQCLHYALSNSIKVGVWGKTTERQRRRLRRERYEDSQS